MGKKTVTGKNREDKFYRIAKESGYRSRAAFKLLQIESKYLILNSSRAILDLCAAPGGWMQVAVKKAPVGALVVGIDLVYITPIRGAISVQQDITEPKCRATVKKLLTDNGFNAFDLILHDGSPNLGGAWFQEATAQNSLVIDSLKLATQFLSPKGHFVTKIFRSQDYTAVVYCLKKFFDKVEVYKPIASRKESAEIYIVCLRYKAPAKIDPRMLDIKYLFEGATEPQKVIDVLGRGRPEQGRTGYPEGLPLVEKIYRASEFVWCDNPIEMLGSVTSISFDDISCLPLKEHALTTHEVTMLCEDLRVLGKQDFKHLLKWRTAIRKAISSTAKTCTIEETTNENEGVEQDEQDEDEKLLDEMEELTHVIERKKKREKKIAAKRQAKNKARTATGMQIDAMQDGYVDKELFSLSSIKGKDDLATIDAAEDVEGSELPDSDDDANDEGGDHAESSDLDSDEERERYDEKLEKILDEAYEQYVTKKGGSTTQRKRAKKAYTEEILEDNDDGDGDDIAEPDDSDKDEADQEANPLLDPIDNEAALTNEQLHQRWFSADLFEESVEQGDLWKDESDDDIVKNVPKHKTSKILQKKTGKVEDELEVVPAPGNSSDSSSSDDDSDTKAEIRAIGKKMLGGKRKRQEMEDVACYNKRVFDDNPQLLPEWFNDYEKTHNQRPKLVTKEERLAEKALFKEIDARPSKKVAEAKARKKRVAMRNLDKTRKKANSIADQTDINDRSKRRMIEQLYKKAKPKKPGKENVVAKKGVQVRPGIGKVLVDRRMKKDARQHGMNTKAKNYKAKRKRSGKASAPMGKNGNTGRR